MGKIECATHGESYETFVCSHLTGGSQRDEPSEDKPFPDAWCDDCEIIFRAHGGWNEESEKLVKIQLLCSGCYERARIRNTRTSVTLDDLNDLRWKCGSCDKWHTGACLDFGYDEPHYWSKKHAEAERRARLSPKWETERPATFLNEDFCAIEDRDFFVRGIINLPIINLPIMGTAEHFRWGVWARSVRRISKSCWRWMTIPNASSSPPCSRG